MDTPQSAHYLHTNNFEFCTDLNLLDQTTSLNFVCKMETKFTLQLQRNLTVKTFQSIFSLTSKYSYITYHSSKCLEIHPRKKWRKTPSKWPSWLRFGTRKMCKRRRGKYISKALKWPASLLCCRSLSPHTVSYKRTDYCSCSLKPSF